MKVCGYCNNEYSDAEPKCPVCGSTLLKHDRHSDPAEAELQRIKSEIQRKRKRKSLGIAIGASVIVLAIVIAIFSITNYATDPQRDIAKESKALVSQAELQINNGNYGEALDILNRIDPEWNNYNKVEQLRLEAVRGQLRDKIEEYQTSGNYEALISFIKSNVSDVSSDAEIKSAYDNAVKEYVADILIQTNKYIKSGDYYNASKVLNMATAVVGDNADINAKLTEVKNGEVQSTIYTYEETEDYVALVDYLGKICNESSDYSELYNQYCKKLVDKTISEAQVLADQRKFEEAIAVIKNVQRHYNSAQFDEKIQEYTDCLPIDLADCHVITSSGQVSVEIGKDVTDVFGSIYANAVHWNNWGSGWGTQEASVTFYPNRKYNTLSGIIAPSGEGSLNGYLVFRADGTEVYRTSEIAVTTEPFWFSIDVRDCGQLTLEYHLNIGDSWSKWGAIVSASLS